MSRHAAAWTGGRIFADRFIGRSTPGKHEASRGLEAEIQITTSWRINPSVEECVCCREIRLDQERGLQPTPYGGMEDRAGFAALAKEVSR